MLNECSDKIMKILSCKKVLFECYCVKLKFFCENLIEKDTFFEGNLHISKFKGGDFYIFNTEQQ